MFAVVEIEGQQFKVSKDEKHYVPKLDAQPEEEVTFDKVLLYFDGKKTSVGTPVLEGKKVTAKVIEHVKDDKVIVFKKKRRKSYKKKNTHRQQLTRIEILNIS